MNSAPAAQAYAVIMAGGVGTRFWPLSRTAYPKQFLDLLGTGRTLLQDTYARMLRLVPPERVLVVTHRQYVPLVMQQLPGLPRGQILAEPAQRNTAAAVAYATAYVHSQDPTAPVVVAPADHLIMEPEAFSANVMAGLSLASQGPVILTLGITPTRPDTGYGYIQYHEVLPAHTPNYEGAFKVKTFTEKPSLEMANAFLASGEFLWNAGLFVFQAATMWTALRKHAAYIAELFETLPPAIATPEEGPVLDAIYARCKSISLDFAVMEKANNVYVIPASFGWSDLGTWTSLYEQMGHDTNENALAGGNASAFDSHRNVVWGQPTKRIVLKAVDDLIVVDMPDVLLICHRSQEQRLREVVADLRMEGNDALL